MPRKKSDTSPSELDVQEKQAFPLTARLNDLITDSTALRKHLDCTAQTISQYRTGTSRPSLENLCKIADFYGVSTDYLLGRTPDDVKTPDMDKRAVCDYTGLSDKAVSMLAAYTKGERPLFPPNAAPHILEVLNTILSSNVGESLILAMYGYLLGQYDAITIDGKNEQGEMTCMSGTMAGLRDKRTGRNEDILSVLDIPTIYLYNIQEYLHILRDKIQPPAMTVELWGD